MTRLPSETEPWLERRASFNVLYIRGGVLPRYEHPGESVTVVSPGATLGSGGFDLVLTSATVQQHFEQWLEDTVICRLKAGGRLVIIDND